MSTVLELKSVSRTFDVREGLLARSHTLTAVDNVSLKIERGQVLGIVGESGCGKTTLAKMMLGLIAPQRGQILLDNQDIATMGRLQLARRIQPIFQDPYSSLNPRRTIGAIVELPLQIAGIGSRHDRRQRALVLLDRVGLPRQIADRYPSQLSGGQRQRVAIARALISNADIIVCDEPTSALDVSVQAQIVNLLIELQRELGLTYVFVSHNLAVVGYIASRVAVMYLGRVVEDAPAANVFAQPCHPYTRALAASVLTPVPGLGLPHSGLGSSQPDPLNVPSGCRFHPRCPQRYDPCTTADPPYFRAGESWVACHLFRSATG